MEVAEQVEPPAIQMMAAAVPAGIATAQELVVAFVLWPVVQEEPTTEMVALVGAVAQRTQPEAAVVIQVAAVETMAPIMPVAAEVSMAEPIKSTYLVYKLAMDWLPSHGKRAK